MKLVRIETGECVVIPEDEDLYEVNVLSQSLKLTYSTLWRSLSRVREKVRMLPEKSSASSS